MSEVQVDNPLTHLEAQSDRSLSPNEQMMVVSLDGDVSPMRVEGTLGGDTDSSGDNEEIPDMPDSPPSSCSQNESELMTAARLDNKARHLKTQSLDEQLEVQTLPRAVALAMESAEVCGRNGREKAICARDLVLSMYEESADPHVEALCAPGVLEAWMTVVSDAAKGKLDVNRPSRFERWVEPCLLSLRAGLCRYKQKANY